MIDYKDIWSDTVLIIALMISVFAFSGYSPEALTPTGTAPHTELIFSQNQETAVKQISIVLSPIEELATTPQFSPFASIATRITANLTEVAFAHLSQEWLQYRPTPRFSFLFSLRQYADEEFSYA